MEQSPSWEANPFPDSQEIPRILWSPQVHYRSNKCPPPVPILSQLEPFHNHTFYFLKIHLNIILPSTPGSLKWHLSLGFPHQNPKYAFSYPHTRYIPHPSHSSRFDHSINVGWGVHIQSHNQLQNSSSPTWMKRNNSFVFVGLFRSAKLPLFSPFIVVCIWHHSSVRRTPTTASNSTAYLAWLWKISKPYIASGWRWWVAVSVARKLCWMTRLQGNVIFWT